MVMDLLEGKILFYNQIDSKKLLPKYLLLPIIVEREAAGKYNLTYQMLRDFDVFFEKFPPTVRNRHAASE